MQEPLAGIEPPVKVTVEPPASAETVPPQVVLPLYPEISMPVGNLSSRVEVKLAAVLLGLVKVMVTTDFALALMEVGANFLVRLTPVPPPLPVTVRVATAAAALVPKVVCNAPAGKVFT